MPLSLGPHAADAAEVTRRLERALEESRGHWDDSTRLGFDQKYAEPLTAHGHKLARALAACDLELSLALSELEQAEHGRPGANR